MPNPIPTYVENPTSTVTLNPWYVQEGNSEWANLGSLAASGTKTFKCEEYPSVFYYSGQGATAAKHAAGFIVATSASTVYVTSHVHLATSGTTADDIVVTISSGTVTLTSPATSETKTNNYICRIS